MDRKGKLQIVDEELAKLEAELHSSILQSSSVRRIIKPYPWIDDPDFFYNSKLIPALLNLRKEQKINYPAIKIYNYNDPQLKGQGIKNDVLFGAPDRIFVFDISKGITIIIFYYQDSYVTTNRWYYEKKGSMECKFSTGWKNQKEENLGIDKLAELLWDLATNNEQVTP